MALGVRVFDVGVDELEVLALFLYTITNTRLSRHASPNMGQGLKIEGKQDSVWQDECANEEKRLTSSTSMSHLSLR